MTSRATVKKLIVPGLALALAAGIAMVPSATANQSAPLTRCPDNLLIAIPGTTETSEDADPNVSRGMLANVTDPLVGEYASDALQVWYDPYMALIVDEQAQTYGTSKASAVHNATTEIADRAAECPHTKFGLLGFSQGADAAGDLASQIGNGTGPIGRDRMFALGLMADPNTQKGIGKALGAPITGVGFAGTRPNGFGTLDDIAVNVCDEEDLYCNTPNGAIGTQFIGALGSNIDARDPVKSVAGIITTLLGLNGVPLTNTLDSLNRSVTTGNFPAIPALALELSTQISQLSADVATKMIPGSNAAAIAATIAQLTGAVGRGDFLAIPGYLAVLAPQVITFAGQLSKMIGELISKLPINEYVAIGATVARISANAAIQNYAALPKDLGKLVGQLNNAVRKTLRALPLDAFPMLNKMADELTPGRVLDEVLNYATFLAVDSHNSYATKSINSSGRTGAEELVNYFRTQISTGGSAVAA